MHIYEAREELENFTYRDCIDWLSFNDHNGCYEKEEQIDEWGEALDLYEMKGIILSQCRE